VKKIFINIIKIIIGAYMFVLALLFFILCIAGFILYALSYPAFTWWQKKSSGTVDI